MLFADQNYMHSITKQLKNIKNTHSVIFQAGDRIPLKVTTGTLILQVDIY